MSQGSESTSGRIAPSKPLDVILSSGFLAFASHLGFLRGLERSNVSPSALVGTSSGALVGALYCAGHSVDAIAQLLTSAPPLRFLRPSLRPWRGAFDSTPLLRLLEAHLPARFEELRWPFAVGVMELEGGRHWLLRDGALPLAVLASCAVPRLISPVAIAGTRFVDGGAADRLGVRAWRTWRPEKAGILHRVERSMGSEHAQDPAGLLTVNSPRSGNSLFRLREFDVQMAAACERTYAVLHSGRPRASRPT